MLNTPKGLAFDAAGNLFIADQGNQRIRKISNGIITTVAGNGTAGYAGDGGPAVNAELWSPTGLAFDAAGNLYFADQGNNRIRVLLTDGTIATVAGNGTAAYGGDGGLALDAALNSPKTVAFSGVNIYIADTGNERIRLLTPSAQTYVTAVNAASYASSPVATDSIVAAFGEGLASQVASASGSLSTTLGGTSVQITDAGGNSIQADLFYVSPTQINLLIPATVASGTAQISVTAADGTISQGQMQIAPVAPGIFTAGNLALGAAIHVDAEGNQTTQQLVQYNAIIGQFQPVPINLGASTDSTYLVLYGTGIRNTLLSQITVSLGGATVAPAYAGAQLSFAGLDQINLQIPNSLAGAGDVVITLTAVGVVSNAVHITIE